MQDAASNIARIDPAQCRLPPGRLPIAPEDCAQLADSIRADGQLVPGLVRRTPPGDPIRYEIICGARRHFAVAALRQTEPGCTQPFFAAIRPLSDEAAFAAADRDNRNRADISDIQRALDYTHALHKYYGGNQDRMARAIRIQPSELSRHLTLASLPEEIFAAFGRPGRLTIALARPLFPHLKNPATHQNILQTAREIAALQKQRVLDGRASLPPKTVLHRLLQAETPSGTRPTHAVTAADGRRLAAGVRRPDGVIHITVTATFPRERATVLTATAEILDNLCGIEKGWAVPTLSVTATSETARAA
jgi:ParB family chromosome partitioning protein